MPSTLIGYFQKECYSIAPSLFVLNSAWKGALMSTEEIFATGRVVERLMVCAFAGLSLTYGWNLFRVGVLNEQSASASARGWRVNLKRVGPGVFFALFGCIVLGIIIRSPLSLPLSTKTSDTASVSHNEVAKNTAAKNTAATDPSEVVYAEGGDTGVSKRWVASLNTILLLAKPDKFPSSTEQKIIKRADEDLETLRNALLIRQFGAPLLGDYNSYRKKVVEYNTPGTEEEQKKFAQIDAWMQGNRIQE